MIHHIYIENKYFYLKENVTIKLLIKSIEKYVLSLLIRRHTN
jgi:hypothetical protein